MAFGRHCFGVNQTEENSRTDSSSVRSIDVGQLVADENAQCQIEIEIIASAKKHARLRLAIGRIVLVSADAVDRMVGTVVHTGNGDSLVCELTGHPFGQLEELRFCIVAPRDTGLIGHHENEIVELLRRSTQLEDPFPELEILASMHIASIDVDDTVPVKKKRLPV